MIDAVDVNSQVTCTKRANALFNLYREKYGLKAGRLTKSGNLCKPTRGKVKQGRLIEKDA